MTEHETSELRLLASKFWGSIPWLLEAAVVMELALGNVAAAVFLMLADATKSVLFGMAHLER